jgi:hypothetical protein
MTRPSARVRFPTLQVPSSHSHIPRAHTEPVKQRTAIGWAFHVRRQHDAQPRPSRGVRGRREHVRRLKHLDPVAHASFLGAADSISARLVSFSFQHPIASADAPAGFRAHAAATEKRTAASFYAEGSLASFTRGSWPGAAGRTARAARDRVPAPCMSRRASQPLRDALSRGTFGGRGSYVPSLLLLLPIPLILLLSSSRSDALLVAMYGFSVRTTSVSYALVPTRLAGIACGVYALGAKDEHGP